MAKLINNIKTEAEARQLAIDWQHEASNKNYSYGELIEQENILRKLATKFNLTEEFKENGII